VREALILAGGLATRLGALAHTTPKSLQVVAGKPLLEHVAWNLARHGVKRVVLSLGHLSDEFAQAAARGLGCGLEVETVVESQPMGTGGALAVAAATLQDNAVLVLNGDTLFDLNYLDLALLLEHSDASVAMALRSMPDAGRYGAVGLDGHLISSFCEKSQVAQGLVNGGVYAMRTELLRTLEHRPHSFERDVLPGLVQGGRVVGKEYTGFFVDIGLPETLASAQSAVARWRAKPLVLFDRDGVLNVDHGHVATQERWEWIPGAREAVKYVNDAGILAAVVTNQAGIAKQLYSHADYLAFEAWIATRLAQSGAHFDAVYHCPHHPQASGELGVVCDCRKPAPGMILRAINELEPDPTRVVLIGDKPSDLQAAAAAGIRGVSFEDGDLLRLVESVVAEIGIQQ
jgi:D,D-heptose 1,7-bisphosphate phosphatase